MSPRIRRYLALAVLAAGIAAIVATIMRGDNPDGDSALTLVSPDAPNAASANAEDGNETVDGGGDKIDNASAEADGGGENAEAEPLAPIEFLGAADTLTDLDGWLNTDASSLEEIRAGNEVTVVQFWTFGCRNCKNTLGALIQLYDDFGGSGLEIVGVHAPEFSYEAEVDRIIEAAAKLGVTWPIALDTHKRNFHRWQEGPTAYWPRVYAIDSDNQIRFDRRGDGAATYRQLYQTVERLLAESA